MRTGSGHLFHRGELAAQKRFSEEWSEQRSKRLGTIIGAELDKGMMRFVENAGFFFLATADSEGHCDCSFKGSEPGAGGQHLQAALVQDPSHVVFPDYMGNHIFNSLGNILTNPHVGMIFIDFAAQRRLRVNGRAKITEDMTDWEHHWPNAQRAVLVAIEQAYWNCSRRIPKQP